MIEFHVITPRGSALVLQVIDGKPILPPENPPIPVPILPKPA